ncbi:hypothetical protein HBI25_110010 [Parastagonospora nodorum]|nr:hypothetical protein HBH52_001080 [Parastagonospora nodorum]KAH4044215.1 hypothetical protein HBH49_221590 [Parastagonospora nodorum]KAH4098744.1 hypothetical protein HBH46_153250 [Parastagonospora nodorum]KAH4265466.1 hypothetical protein HBI03_085250 [Parastagonospora nodorum]KAH4283483.1 hypothetical protein HBI04_023660 [Parastagonospora nodorum]
MSVFNIVEYQAGQRNPIGRGFRKNSQGQLSGRKSTLIAFALRLRLHHLSSVSVDQHSTCVRGNIWKRHPVKTQFDYAQRPRRSRQTFSLMQSALLSPPPLVTRVPHLAITPHCRETRHRRDSELSWKGKGPAGRSCTTAYAAGMKLRFHTSQ